MGSIENVADKNIIRAAFRVVNGTFSGLHSEWEMDVLGMFRNRPS